MLYNRRGAPNTTTIIASVLAYLALECQLTAYLCCYMPCWVIGGRKGLLIMQWPQQANRSCAILERSSDQTPQVWVECSSKRHPSLYLCLANVMSQIWIVNLCVGEISKVGLNPALGCIMYSLLQLVTTHEWSRVRCSSTTKQYFVQSLVMNTLKGHADKFWGKPTFLLHAVM